MNLPSKLTKIAKRIMYYCSEMLRENIHQLTRYAYLKKHTKLSIEDNRFVGLNNQYWKETKKNNIGETPSILVEGFFANAGHNYVIRTGMLAKAIQSKDLSKITVLFDKPSYRLIKEKEKYKSFEIDHFVYIRPGLYAIFCFLKSVYHAIKHSMYVKNSDDLINLNHHQVHIGDLIYDDLLKSEKGKYTLFSIDFVCFKRLVHTLYYYHVYEGLFKTQQYKHLVTTHLVYAQYGLLARVALKYGCNVIETNDLMVNYLNHQDYFNKAVSPTYHSVMHQRIRTELKQSTQVENDVIWADDAIKKRMSGEVKQFDARFAYQNKLVLQKEDFLRKLNLENGVSQPIGVIFAHIFSDAPHSSEKILFRDYFDWLNETIRCAHQLQNINWVVKAHPSSSVYQEDGIVKDCIQKTLKTSLRRNIGMFPEQTSAANLHEIADAVITVQGTAGLEFSCLGLPVILAGQSFYANYGFTFDPDSKEAYFDLLKQVGSLKRLSSEQMNVAKRVYRAFMKVIGNDSHIISSDALNAIWGYGDNGEVDIELGNKIMNDSLEKHDPRNEFQYRYVYENV